jgi:hypothetical protein
VGSGDYRETLERCLAEFGWKEKRSLQGREIDRRYQATATPWYHSQAITALRVGLAELGRRPDAEHAH